MKAELMELTDEFDRLTLEVLGPLRMEKIVDREALDRLKAVLERFRILLGDEELVPRELVGKLWFIFTAMLAEADHAKNPDPILNAAWGIQDRLRRIFGPRF